MTRRLGLLAVLLTIATACGSSGDESSPAVVSTVTPEASAPSTTLAPTSTGAPTTTTEPRSALASDARITPASRLADPNDCKIPDITPHAYPTASGFPRNPNGVDSLSDLKLLVVPVSVEDSVFDDSDLAIVEEMLDSAGEYFSDQSFSRVSLDANVAPRESWVTLPGTAESTGMSNMTFAHDKTSIFRDTVVAAAETLDLAAYDMIAVYTHKDDRFFFGQGIFDVDTPDGNLAHGVLMGGQNVILWTVLAHEIIHAWLLSEDLYHFEFRDQLMMGGWDIMDKAVSLNIEINSWTRWINSWITDSQVRCIVSPGQSVHYLETISKGSDENKMAVVRLSDHSVLVLDSRRQFEFGVTGYDSNGSAVLAYVVDTSIPHGEGPFRWRGELRNVGDTLATDGVTITLVGADDTSDLVSVEVG